MTRGKPTERTGPGSAGAHSRRGQIFSSDFIVSVVIFSLVLAILIPLWSTLSVQIVDTESRKDLQATAVAISDLFTRSSGTPENWSANDVRSIGLANTAHELNTTKFLRLREIDYNASQILLGLLPYNFSANVSERNGYQATSGVARSPVAYYSESTNLIFTVLNGSALTWDYYYGAGVPADPPSAQGSARTLYAGDPADMLNAMLFNASASDAYRTIIIEQASVTRAQANLTALRQFVQNGGRLIFTGQGNGGEILLDGFGMTAYNGAAPGAVVNVSDWFMPGQNGDSASFTSSSWAFYQSAEAGDAPIVINIADTSNSSHGLVASWDYGRGRIYYVTDMDGSASGQGLASLLQIAGQPLSYGVPPTNSSYDIFNIVRPEVLTTDGNDGKRMVSLELLFWR